MKIYKFQDRVDGEYAFVLAAGIVEAERVMQSITSLPFELVEARNVEEVKPTIIRSDILPF